MEFIRYRLDERKCIQGTQLLACHMPGITQYYVGKSFFFADREHARDWGRTISGDRYVAMWNGPVPSHVYDLLKGSGEPDDVEDEISRRLRFEHEGNKIKVFSKAEEPSFPDLSRTDREYLLAALERIRHMSFGAIKELSHEDEAYVDAWGKPGLNNEMNPALWFGGDDGFLAQVLESHGVTVLSTPRVTETG